MNGKMEDATATVPETVGDAAEIKASE